MIPALLQFLHCTWTGGPACTRLLLTLVCHYESAADIGLSRTVVTVMDACSAPTRLITGTLRDIFMHILIEVVEIVHKYRTSGVT